jgi:hypothetical protein
MEDSPVDSSSVTLKLFHGSRAKRPVQLDASEVALVFSAIVRLEAAVTWLDEHAPTEPCDGCCVKAYRKIAAFCDNPTNSLKATR